MTILRVALIAGPQYDGLLAELGAFTAATGIGVEVAYRGDHAALNEHLAHRRAGAAYDVVCTHNKYAPSQAAWLLPLDDLIDLTIFRPAAVALCRYQGHQLCIPRNIDARLLWYRRDLLGDEAPSTWDTLLEHASTVIGAAGFAFPCRGSGLFGTFFELAAAFGGALFDQDLTPHLDAEGARLALGWLVDAHRTRRATPPGMEAWYFDEVSAGFREGQVAMIGDWPGYYGLLVDSGAAAVADVARYPTGPTRRAVYAGAHAFAIGRDSAQVPAAVRLLRHLTSADVALREAGRGMVPARVDVDVPTPSPLDRRRADLLAVTIAEDLLTFPALTVYPEIEEVAAASIRAAVLGRIDERDALAAAQAAAVAAIAAAGVS